MFWESLFLANKHKIQARGGLGWRVGLIISENYSCACNADVWWMIGWCMATRQGWLNTCQLEVHYMRYVMYIMYILYIIRGTLCRHRVDATIWTWNIVRSFNCRLALMQLTVIWRTLRTTSSFGDHRYRWVWSGELQYSKSSRMMNELCQFLYSQSVRYIVFYSYRQADVLHATPYK